MATKKSKETSTFGKVWRVILCLAVPLGGGFLISLLTRDAMGQFDGLDKPFLAPPAWLFPVAWTILYLLMGLASYLVYRDGAAGKKAERSMARTALVIYGVQLAFNFAWTVVFFNLGWYWFAFAWLMVMWVLEIVLVCMARKISVGAFWCLLPYLLWTTFAAYLNLMIAVLN